MDIYNYDKSGVYLSRSQARPDPLETAKNPSKPQYLIPANATSIAPPPVGPNQVAVFSTASQSWSVVEDNRNTLVYSKTNGGATRVTQVGPLASNLTAIAPPSDGNAYTMVNGAWTVDTATMLSQVRTVRDNLLTDCDYTQLQDTALTPAQVKAWRTYRQALRDYTSNWYLGKPWPVAPASTPAVVSNAAPSPSSSAAPAA
jgi:hypothetical protein